MSHCVITSSSVRREEKRKIGDATNDGKKWLDEEDEAKDEQDGESYGEHGAASQVHAIVG